MWPQVEETTNKDKALIKLVVFSCVSSSGCYPSEDIQSHFFLFVKVRKFLFIFLAKFTKLYNCVLSSCKISKVLNFPRVSHNINLRERQMLRLQLFLLVP